jgi:hypothetical protein
VVAELVSEDQTVVERRTPARSQRGYVSTALWALAIFIGSRLIGLVAALASTWLEPTLKMSYIFRSWDGYWYLRIAQHGYPNTVAPENAGNRWAFFPAYPFAIRFTHAVTSLSYADAGIVLGLLFGAAAAVLIALLVREVFSEQAAYLSVALFVFFPSSFVLGMVYPDGLLLALVAGALLAMYKKRWLTAAVLVNLACLTRLGGVALLVAMGVELLRPENRAQWRRILVACILSSLAFVAWCLYGHARTGELLAFAKAEKAWGGAHFVWFETPFKSLGHLLTRTSAWHSGTEVDAGLALLMVIAGYLILIHFQVRGPGMPLSWWAYTLMATAVAFSAFWPSSVLRYTLVLIPMIAVFAYWVRPQVVYAVIGAFGLYQGLLAVVTWVSLANGHGITPP